MVFPEDIEGVDPATAVVIQNFSDTYHSAMDALEDRSYEKARELYIELLRHYQDLRGKRIDPIHCNIAYSCIEDLYNDLQHRVEVPVVSGTGLKVGICVSILLVLISIFVISKPSVVGLASLDSFEPVEAVWMGPEYMTIDDITTFNLNDYVDGPFDMTYLVAEGSGLQVYQDASIITLVPPRGFKGRSSFTVYGYKIGRENRLLLKKEIPVLMI